MKLTRRRPRLQTSNSAWAERQAINSSFSGTFFRRVLRHVVSGSFETVGDFITIHVCGPGDDCRETCHVERLYRRVDVEELVCPNCVSHGRKP